MKFNEPLKPAKLIKRYKRFLADIELPDGEEITLHCPNTGSMRNCQDESANVWYSWSDNAKRKYPGTWELVEVEQKYLASVNTHRANALVEEAILSGMISELASYETLRREVKYGEEGSRIDFLLSDPQKADCYVEVKSVTLLSENNLGLFPDAVTTRGAKHLRELMQMKAAGNRAVLFFCAQHTGINRVAPADEIDPNYGSLLREAISAGVEVIAYGCDMDNESISVSKSLPVIV